MSIENIKSKIFLIYESNSIDVNNNLNKYKEKSILEDFKTKIFMPTTEIRHFQQLNMLDFNYLKDYNRLNNENYIKPITTYSLDYKDIKFEVNSMKNNAYIGKESKKSVSQLFLNKFQLM